MGYKIEYLPAEKLKVNPENPRLIRDDSFARLVKSLNDCPQLFDARPCLCSDRTGELIILAGNMRFLAAKELKHKKVPAIIMSGLSEAQEKEILIKDNGTTWGEWDLDLLEKDYGDLPLEEWGVDLSSDWMAAGGGPQKDAEPQVDKAKELQKKWKTKRGQLWQLGSHLLLCGDSRIKEDLEKLMGDEKAQVIYTDPPYGVDYTDSKGQGIQNDDLKQNALSDLVRTALMQCVERANEDAGFYIWHASSTRRDFEYAIDGAGLEEKQYITWVKDSMVLGRSDYHWQSEPCFYCQKAGQTASWFGDRSNTTVWRVERQQAEGVYALGVGLQISDGGEDQLIIRAKKPKSQKLRHLRIIPGQTIRIIGHATSDAWEISRDVRTEYLHPNQKPVELAEKAIRNSSAQEQIVLDPFLGSGTTVIACENLKRICRAVELSPEYTAVALQRWTDATGKTPERIE